jgi:hypothetical protein
MENSIAFRYNPVKYKFSFLDVIVNVRAHYKTEDIFIYLDDNRDDLDFYQTIGNRYNLKIILREIHRTFIDRKDAFEVNLPKIAESVNRLYHTCVNTDAKWIINLEDDVHIKQKIKHFPTTDVGTNREHIGFVGGGGILLRTKFIEVYETLSDEQMTHLFTKNKDYIWATDAIMRCMYSMVGFTSEKWIELAEPGYYDNRDHAVFHGNKDLHKLG